MNITTIREEFKEILQDSIFVFFIGGFNYWILSYAFHFNFLMINTIISFIVCPVLEIINKLLVRYFGIYNIFSSFVYPIIRFSLLLPIVVGIVLALFIGILYVLYKFILHIFAFEI